MNKDEIFKDMETAIGEALGLTYEGESLPFRLHTRNYLAKALINENYRKIADDEIVLKKSEINVLKNRNDRLKTELKICERELEKAKKETAREILQEILGIKSDNDKWIENAELVGFGNKIVDKIEQLAQKYGVELE